MCWKCRNSLFFLECWNYVRIVLNFWSVEFIWGMCWKMCWIFVRYMLKLCKECAESVEFGIFGSAVFSYEKCWNYIRNVLTSAENIFIQLIQRLKLNFQHIQHVPYKISAHSAHLKSRPGHEKKHWRRRNGIDPNIIWKIRHKEGIWPTFVDSFQGSRCLLIRQHTMELRSALEMSIFAVGYVSFQPHHGLFFRERAKNELLTLLISYLSKVQRKIFTISSHAINSQKIVFKLKDFNIKLKLKEILKLIKRDWTACL